MSWLQCLISTCIRGLYRHEMLIWWTRPLCIDCCIPKVIISKDYAWTIPCNILKYPYPKQWYCTPWVCYNFCFFGGLLYVHLGYHCFEEPLLYLQYQHFLFEHPGPSEGIRLQVIHSSLARRQISVQGCEIFNFNMNHNSQLQPAVQAFYSMNTSSSCKGNNRRLTVG